MHPLSLFNAGTLVYGDETTGFDSQIIIPFLGGAGHKTAVTPGISEIKDKKLPLVQPEGQGVRLPVVSMVKVWTRSGRRAEGRNLASRLCIRGLDKYHVQHNFT